MAKEVVTMSKMEKLFRKFNHEGKRVLVYNIHPNSKLVLNDINYNEINTWIKNLRPGQNIIIRLYDCSGEDYMEDTCITIKVYSNNNYRRFSFKVYYMNGKENVIHPMMVESQGHSYELKFNDESVKYGMRWNMRTAIENVLHMCYTHIYDYSIMPVVVIDDAKPQNMQKAVDKFIGNIQANYESPRSCMFMVKSIIQSSVIVTVCPSYANITVRDYHHNISINYPLFPVPVERKAISVIHPRPIFKLIDMIVIKAYLCGLYRRRLENKYALGQLIQGTGHSRYKVESNPEMREVAYYTDYCAENLAKMFIDRFKEVVAPFWTNMFRYEYVFYAYDERRLTGYTMKIGVLTFKDYALVYAYETKENYNRTVSICSKVVSPFFPVYEEITSDFIRERGSATRSGISTNLMANEVSGYIIRWLGAAKGEFKRKQRVLEIK